MKREATAVLALVVDVAATIAAASAEKGTASKPRQRVLQASQEARHALVLSALAFRPAASQTTSSRGPSLATRPTTTHRLHPPTHHSHTPNNSESTTPFKPTLIYVIIPESLCSLSSCTALCSAFSSFIQIICIIFQFLRFPCPPIGYVLILQAKTRHQHQPTSCSRR